MSNYRRFRWVRQVIEKGKLLIVAAVLFLMIQALLNLVLLPPRPQPLQAAPAVPNTYRSYRNYLRTIVQKQLTPAGADSMRYILLTDPQVNNNHTLWHYAVPGQHLSTYTPAAAQPLTIVNESPYDAVFFVVEDSTLYNAFLSKGDSVQTAVTAHDTLSFYVGYNWVPPGSMKRGVYPWTDEKALYGIFTQVDTTTLSQLDKIYVLAPGSTTHNRLRVLLTARPGGLQLVPDSILVQELPGEALRKALE